MGGWRGSLRRGEEEEAGEEEGDEEAPNMEEEGGTYNAEGQDDAAETDANSMAATSGADIDTSAFVELHLDGAGVRGGTLILTEGQPCYAALTAAVPCEKGNPLLDGTSIEAICALAMSVNRSNRHRASPISVHFFVFYGISGMVSKKVMKNMGSWGMQNDSQMGVKSSENLLRGSQRTPGQSCGKDIGTNPLRRCKSWFSRVRVVKKIKDSRVPEKVIETSPKSI